MTQIQIKSNCDNRFRILCIGIDSWNLNLFPALSSTYTINANDATAYDLGGSDRAIRALEVGKVIEAMQKKNWSFQAALRHNIQSVKSLLPEVSRVCKFVNNGGQAYWDQNILLGLSVACFTTVRCDKQTRLWPKNGYKIFFSAARHFWCECSFIS